MKKMQQESASRRLAFDSFLQAPTRKIQRVLLLFAEIVKNTEETNRDRETLQKASDELKLIVHECDARYFLLDFGGLIEERPRQRPI
jgi:RhoGEF domain